MATLLDNCGFNPTTGGTTNWTYSSRIGGYNNPADAGITNGSVVKYHAFSADRSQWEIGEGAYNTGTGVLARTTVMFNSSQTGATGSGQSGAGTKINFSAAPTVVIVGLAEDLLSKDGNLAGLASPSTARTNLGISIGVPDVILEDQKSSGTAAGASTSGSWQTRTLNTLVRNNGSLASLSSNQVTLGAGSYYFNWSVPAFFSNGHKTRLQNVTDGTTSGAGSSEYCANGVSDMAQSRSLGSCFVTIAGSRAFELQHQVAASKSINGLGVATSLGTEVYARLEITKVG